MRRKEVTADQMTGGLIEFRKKLQEEKIQAEQAGEPGAPPPSQMLESAAAKKAPREVEGMMTVLVPVVSKAMWDVKKAVKEQAEETLEDICGSIDNIDIVFCALRLSPVPSRRARRSSSCSRAA